MGTRCANMTGMDVAVVGAGVVGCALASALARRGRAVVVLERAAQRGHRRHQPQQRGDPQRPVLPAGLAQGRSPVSADRLCSTRGREPTMCRTRAPASWWSRATSRGGRAGRAARQRRRRGGSWARWLDAAEVAAASPRCRRARRAVVWRTGIVDAHALTRSLRVDAERCGATFALQGELLAVTPGPGLRLDDRARRARGRRAGQRRGLESDRVAALPAPCAPADLPVPRRLLPPARAWPSTAPSCIRARAAAAPASACT
jgi:glycine/D-amino acid oxidase-like deaminating enzyme